MNYIPSKGQAGAWRSQRERQAPAWRGDLRRNCSCISWTIYFGVCSFPSSSSHRYTSPVKPRKAVISAGMPTNSLGTNLDARSAGRSPNHMDVVRQSRPWTVSSRLHKCLIQITYQPVDSCLLIRGHLSRLRVCHPWTLDFGIHAEMTNLQHLRITMRTPAWEWFFCSSSFLNNGQAVACKIRVPKPEFSPLYTSQGWWP